MLGGPLHRLPSPPEAESDRIYAEALSLLHQERFSEAGPSFATSTTAPLPMVPERAGVLFPAEGGYVAFFFDLDNDGHLDLFASTMSAFPGRIAQREAHYRILRRPP